MNTFGRSSRTRYMPYWRGTFHQNSCLVTNSKRHGYLRKSKALCAKEKNLQKAEETGNLKDIKHYKEDKARLQRAERQSYWNFVDNIIEAGDPEQEHQPMQKRFWSFIKSLRKDTSGVAPLQDNERLHPDPKDKADILNRQYGSTWTKENTDAHCKSRTLRVSFPLLFFLRFPGVAASISPYSMHRLSCDLAQDNQS